MIKSTLKTYIKITQESSREAIPVLHIIKSLGRGGAEVLLPETLQKHDKTKFDFHYIYFLPWKNQMVEAIEQAGGKVKCVAAKNNIGILLNCARLVSYVKKNKIQLIHCHLPWAGIIGRLVGKITSVPVIYTEHNKWERYHRVTYYLNKLSFGNQQKVIAVSSEVEKSIKSHYKKRNPPIQVVANGIDWHKFSNINPVYPDIRKLLNIDPKSIVIGTTCVFRAQKRMTTWLQIASMLHTRYPGIVFIIVGDGVLKNEIIEQSKILGTENYVHFAGLQADTRPYLKAMDIFMMCSEFEGLPIALLEAMSMGCLPACTAAGGINDVIHNNKNGILVPVSYPYQLADRIAECLQQPYHMQQMKSAAQQTIIQSFGMEKMVNALEGIYQEVLKK